MAHLVYTVFAQKYGISLEEERKGILTEFLQ